MFIFNLQDVKRLQIAQDTSKGTMNIGAQVIQIIIIIIVVARAPWSLVKEIGIIPSVKWKIGMEDIIFCQF